MVRANHHPVIYPFFKWLSRRLVRRNFSLVTIEADFHDNGCGVLVIANHVSWWDGFWVEHLNQQVLRRKLHFMMRQEQLRRHWYFGQAGGYPVQPGSRQAAESIAYTVELLAGPGNLVLMFPQGQIHSAHCQAFRFRRGVDHILARAPDPAQVLLVANLTDYFSNARPNLFTYARGYTVGQLRGVSLEQEYNRFYQQVLAQHQTRTS